MNYTFDIWPGKHSPTWEAHYLYDASHDHLWELNSKSGVEETGKIFSSIAMLRAEVPVTEDKLTREKPSVLKNFREHRILHKEME